uniref:Uncharacterized protein n=1 Tax=Oryza brachyantha TaxID=4533 RepID=J3NAK0_ORYBR
MQQRQMKLASSSSNNTGPQTATPTIIDVDAPEPPPPNDCELGDLGDEWFGVDDDLPPPPDDGGEFPHKPWKTARRACPRTAPGRAWPVATANYASFSFDHALKLEEKLQAQEREADAMREELEEKARSELAAAVQEYLRSDEHSPELAAHVLEGYERGMEDMRGVALRCYAAGSALADQPRAAARSTPAAALQTDHRAEGARRRPRKLWQPHAPTPRRPRRTAGPHRRCRSTQARHPHRGRSATSPCATEAAGARRGRNSSSSTPASSKVKPLRPALGERRHRGL